jgi:hypothetical protein
VPPGFAFAGWINFRGPIIKVEAELYAFRGLNCATNSTSNCFPFGKRDPDKLASLGVEYLREIGDGPDLQFTGC